MNPTYTQYLRNRTAMLAEWGERCPESDLECPACMAWRLFDCTGRVPESATVRDALGDAEHFSPRREADTAYQYPARGPVTPELFARFGPR